MSYSRWWRSVWSVLTALGVGLAILQMSPVAAAVAMVVLVPCALVALVLVRSFRGERSSTAGTDGAEGKPAAGSLVAQAVRWGAVLLAAVTVTGESPPIAVLLAVLVVATSPPVVDRCRAALGRPPRPRTGRRQAPPVADGTASGPATSLVDAGPTAAPALLEDLVHVVTLLSDAELCALWRSTFWELHQPHTDDQRLTLVLLRGTCLDELDRRDPAALQAWLASGARASSAPDRYLHRPGDDRGRGRPDAA